MDEKYPELGDATVTKSFTIAPKKRMSIREAVDKKNDREIASSDEAMLKIAVAETEVLSADKIKIVDETTKDKEAESIPKEVVSLEYIGAYPPGIPLVVPGEVITRELLEEIKGLEKAGIYVKTSGRCYPKVKVVK